MLTLPNFLTLLRIIAVPVFLILVNNHHFGAGLVLFMAAGITDSFFLNSGGFSRSPIRMPMRAILSA